MKESEQKARERGEPGTKAAYGKNARTSGLPGKSARGFKE